MSFNTPLDELKREAIRAKQAGRDDLAAIIAEKIRRAEAQVQQSEWGEDALSPSKNGFDDFRAGVGRSIVKTGRGAGTLLGLTDRENARNESELWDKHASGWAQGGEFAGDVAQGLAGGAYAGAKLAGSGLLMNMGGQAGVGVAQELLQQTGDASGSTGENVAGLLFAGVGGALGEALAPMTKFGNRRILRPGWHKISKNATDLEYGRNILGKSVEEYDLTNKEVREFGLFVRRMEKINKQAYDEMVNTGSMPSLDEALRRFDMQASADEAVEAANRVSPGFREGLGQLFEDPWGMIKRSVDNVGEAFRPDRTLEGRRANKAYHESLRQPGSLANKARQINRDVSQRELDRIVSEWGSEAGSANEAGAIAHRIIHDTFGQETQLANDLYKRIDVDQPISLDGYLEKMVVRMEEILKKGHIDEFVEGTGINRVEAAKKARNKMIQFVDAYRNLRMGTGETVLEPRYLDMPNAGSIEGPSNFTYSSSVQPYEPGTPMLRGGSSKLPDGLPVGENAHPAWRPVQGTAENVDLSQATPGELAGNPGMSALGFSARGTNIPAETDRPLQNIMDWRQTLTDIRNAHAKDPGYAISNLFKNEMDETLMDIAADINTPEGQRRAIDSLLDADANYWHYKNTWGADDFDGKLVRDLVEQPSKDGAIALARHIVNTKNKGSVGMIEHLLEAIPEGVSEEFPKGIKPEIQALVAYHLVGGMTDANTRGMSLKGLRELAEGSNPVYSLLYDNQERGQLIKLLRMVERQQSPMQVTDGLGASAEHIAGGLPFVGTVIDRASPIMRRGSAFAAPGSSIENHGLAAVMQNYFRDR